MTNMENIKAYLETCPLLHDGKFQLTGLEVQQSTFAVEENPLQPVVKTFTDGGKVKQLGFCIVSSKDLSEETAGLFLQQEFCSKLAGWLEKQSAKKKLPQINGEATPLSIDVDEPVFTVEKQGEENKNKIKISCKVTYFQGGNE